MKKILIGLILTASVCVNGWQWWKNHELEKAVSAAQLDSSGKVAGGQPKIMINTEKFDFSTTTLSDSSWQIAEPDKSAATPPTFETPVIKAFDSEPAK